MTIYPLSGASWPARKQASITEDAQSHGKSKAMQQIYVPSRGTPRQWELRKVTSLPVLDADYWSDASLSLPHLAIKLPESVDNTASSALLSLHIETPSSPSSNPFQVPKSRSRCAAFPPPLDSPAISEGPYHYMQSVDKVCFTSLRSNGRLLLLQTPYAEQIRRRLRSQRRNGRLLLQLYEESNHSEMAMEKSPLVGEAGEGGEVQETQYRKSKDPIAEKKKQEDPIAEKAVQENPTAQRAKQEDPIAGKALLEGDPTEGKADGGDPLAENAKEEAMDVRKAGQLSERESATFTLVAAEEEENEKGGGECKIDGDERKPSIHTKVLRTLECDAFSDCSAEVLNLLYGRSNGVASFFHKSLTRVRPLTMLNV